MSKLIMVEWVDSKFYQGWHSKKYSKDHPISNIVTSGLLIHEDTEKITMVLNITKDGEDIADGITIPKCAIKRIRELRVK